MGKGARHTSRLEATRELFVPVTGDISFESQLGDFTGALVDTDADEAYATILVPWDFGFLMECGVRMIPNATTTAGAPMTLTVDVSSPAVGAIHLDNNTSNAHAKVTTVNLLSEVDIKTQVDRGRLSVGDRLGFRIHRVAGQNTNALVLGVRFRYHVKSGSMP